MTKWNLDQAATALWIPVAELAPNQISGAQSKIFGELRAGLGNLHRTISGVSA
jgi:hypothetical protein